MAGEPPGPGWVVAAAGFVLGFPLLMWAGLWVWRALLWLAVTR